MYFTFEVNVKAICDSSLIIQKFSILTNPQLRYRQRSSIDIITTLVEAELAAYERVANYLPRIDSAETELSSFA